MLMYLWWVFNCSYWNIGLCAYNDFYPNLILSSFFNYDKLPFYDRRCSWLRKAVVSKMLTRFRKTLVCQWVVLKSLIWVVFEYFIWASLILILITWFSSASYLKNNKPIFLGTFVINLLLISTLNKKFSYTEMPVLPVSLRYPILKSTKCMRLGGIYDQVVTKVEKVQHLLLCIIWFWQVGFINMLEIWYLMYFDFLKKE